MSIWNTQLYSFAEFQGNLSELSLHTSTSPLTTSSVEDPTHRDAVISQRHTQWIIIRAFPVLFHDVVFTASFTRGLKISSQPSCTCVLLLSPTREGHTSWHSLWLEPNHVCGHLTPPICTDLCTKCFSRHNFRITPLPVYTRWWTIGGSWQVTVLGNQWVEVGAHYW